MSSIQRNNLLCVCVCVCVCVLRLKRGIHNVRAKNLKNYAENAESWIMEGRFSDQPDRQHGNPLDPFEPAMT